MRTQITRIGRTVPDCFEGTVRAVWHKAIAVEVTAAAHPKRATERRPAFVTLVREDVPMTAASMALRVGPDVDFCDSGVWVGDSVSAKGGTLLVGSRSLPHLLAAVTTGTESYDGRLRGSGGPLPNPSSLEWIARAAHSRREAVCPRGTLARAALDKCDALLDTLASCASRDDASEIEAVASSLLGLGPGLTPSGDDALCGLILGRRLLGAERSDVDDALAHVASVAAVVTTDVSAVHVELAAQGRFGETLLDVASALWTHRAHHLTATVDRCLQQGATSGADALLGLVAGARSGQAERVARGGMTTPTKEDYRWQ